MIVASFTVKVDITDDMIQARIGKEGEVTAELPEGFIGEVETYIMDRLNSEDSELFYSCVDVEFENAE